MKLDDAKKRFRRPERSSKSTSAGSGIRSEASVGAQQIARDGKLVITTPDGTRREMTLAPLTDMSEAEIARTIDETTAAFGGKITPSHIEIPVDFHIGADSSSEPVEDFPRDWYPPRFVGAAMPPLLLPGGDRSVLKAEIWVAEADDKIYAKFVIADMPSMEPPVGALLQWNGSSWLIHRVDRVMPSASSGLAKIRVLACRPAGLKWDAPYGPMPSDRTSISPVGATTKIASGGELEKLAGDRAGIEALRSSARVVTVGDAEKMLEAELGGLGSMFIGSKATSETMDRVAAEVYKKINALKAAGKLPVGMSAPRVKVISGSGGECSIKLDWKEEDLEDPPRWETGLPEWVEAARSARGMHGGHPMCKSGVTGDHIDLAIIDDVCCDHEAEIEWFHIGDTSVKRIRLDSYEWDTVHNCFRLEPCRMCKTEVPSVFTIRKASPYARLHDKTGASRTGLLVWLGDDEGKLGFMERTGLEWDPPGIEATVDLSVPKDHIRWSEDSPEHPMYKSETACTHAGWIEWTEDKRPTRVPLQAFWDVGRKIINFKLCPRCERTLEDGFPHPGPGHYPPAKLYSAESGKAITGHLKIFRGETMLGHHGSWYTLSRSEARSTCAHVGKLEWADEGCAPSEAHLLEYDVVTGELKFCHCSVRPEAPLVRSSLKRRDARVVRPDGHFIWGKLYAVLDVYDARHVKFELRKGAKWEKPEEAVRPGGTDYDSLVHSSSSCTEAHVGRVVWPDKSDRSRTIYLKKASPHSRVVDLEACGCTKKRSIPPADEHPVGRLRLDTRGDPMSGYIIRAPSFDTDPSKWQFRTGGWSTTCYHEARLEWSYGGRIRQAPLRHPRSGTDGHVIDLDVCPNCYGAHVLPKITELESPKATIIVFKSTEETHLELGKTIGELIYPDDSGYPSFRPIKTTSSEGKLF